MRRAVGKEKNVLSTKAASFKKRSQGSLPSSFYLHFTGQTAVTWSHLAEFEEMW
jgi:hypothetical protein